MRHRGTSALTARIVEDCSEDRVRMVHVFVDLHLGDWTATAARQGPGGTLVSWIVRAQDTGGVRGMACACAAVATREPTVLKESVRQARSRK